MPKYKRKHRKNNVLLIGIIVIAVLIFISTGYALWQDSLYIKGTANIKLQEQKLDTITVNKTNSQYIAFTDNTWFSSAFTVQDTQLSNTNEKIEIIGNYTKRSFNLSGRNVTFTLNFTNNYSKTITNGKITLLENDTEYSVEPTVTETVVSGQNGTISIKLTLPSVSYLTGGTIQYKISYEVEEVTRYLYVTINIT
jgi:hypothetical protein